MPSMNARDIHERLKPLRRILDDLEAAIDATTKIESNVQGHKAEIAQLGEAVLRARKEAEEAKADAAAALKSRESAMATLNADLARARQDAKNETDALNEHVKKLRQALTEATQQHEVLLKRLGKEEDAARASLETVKQELAAARRDAEARLTALRG